MNTEHGSEIEPEDTGAAEGESQQRRSRRRRRRRHGLVWEFFHPGPATWDAPGERKAKTGVDRLKQRMDQSPGLRTAVAIGTLLLVCILAVSGWALTRAGGDSDQGSPAPASASSEPAEAEDDAAELPGEAKSGAAAEGGRGSSEEPVQSGREADEAALEQINEGDGLVRARAEDSDDPLVTGARFLRSLRSTDTTSDSVEDWYAARDSFLSESQTGAQEDWGAAGEREAVSSAEVSWAEMDAAIVDGRGIAPDFAFGPEAEPGTHLVQVGMRLDRQISVDGEEVETPSGALMEAVVVCPPAEGVDRCVVTRWAEEPAGFTASMDDSWVVYQ